MTYYLIFGIHVGTILEQQLERLDVAAFRGPQECRPLGPVPGFDVDLGPVQQVLDYLGDHTYMTSAVAGVPKKQIN